MSEKKVKTVLYVDDEEPNLFIFRVTFENKYKVILASSAREGLEKLENGKDEIDVVISDMRMPLMDGIEFIRIAKSRFQSISYHILTAFSYNDEIEAALNEKVIDSFFMKPINTLEIENAIESDPGSK